MVLSNKKLKQKLREAATESLTASDPTRESLKALLKSKARKREKVRENPLSKTLVLQNGVTNGGSESDGLIEKKKKRKREKVRENPLSKTLVLENGVTNGGSESEGLIEKKKKRKREKVGLEEKKVVSVKKKKKKKKKKYKKSEKKVEKEEIEKKNESENGGNRESEEIGTHTIEANYNTNDGQDTEEAAMKVYVGGIPYYSSEDDIRSYFESCGTITEIDCMMFPESGKFRGIAIISFKTDAAAKRALALDGSDMGGLFLKVVPYKPAKAKKYSEDFSPSILEGYNRIYIGNLSWNITEDELKNFFYGCKISSIRFGEDKETKEFRGYAHVDFADSVSLNKALELDQEIVCGRPIRVRCAVPPKNKVINGNTQNVNDETSEIKAETANADVAVMNTVIEEVSGKIRRRTCYECGEKGHLSSSCPKKKAADLANGGET